jgi:rhomboid protease GluP
MNTVSSHTNDGSPEPAPGAPDDAVIAFHRQLFRLTPRAWLTHLIIAANVLVFGAMVARGVGAMKPSNESLVAWGANYGPLTLGTQWWRLATSMFIHVGAIHILMNMLVLWSIGRFIERLFGQLGSAVLYLLAGLGGSVASVAIHPFTVSAGASGAVFGLYGGLIGFLLRQRGSIPKVVLTGLGKGAGTFLLYNLIFGLVPNVDMAAHVGGLLTGIAAGAALALPIAEANTPRRRVPRALVVLLAGLVAVAGVTFALPRPPDLNKELGDFSSAESQAVAIYNGAVEKRNRGALDDAGQAAVLDAQAIPLFRSMHARMEALSAQRLDKAQKDLVARLGSYADARAQQWQHLSAAMKTHDQDEAKEAARWGAQADDLVNELKKK